jgi:hypothetical protein
MVARFCWHQSPAAPLGAGSWVPCIIYRLTNESHDCATKGVPIARLTQEVAIAKKWQKN